MLGLLGATSLTACAPALPTAQLGEDPFEGGIGGTGIVGLMTGTGSILVNGLRVEVTSSTRIFGANTRMTDSALTPGRMLTVLARSRLGRFEAQRIDIDDPLTGIVARDNGGVTVNGTRLHGLPMPPGLVGARVTVGGVWQADGSVRASLVQPVRAEQDTVSGVLSGSRSDGWQIGQTPIDPPRNQSLIAGQFAVAKGAFADGVLRTAQIRFGRFRERGETLRQLSVEGYLEPVATAPGFRLAGLGHSFDRRLQLAGFAAQRAVYFGPYTGRFVARRAVLLPEDRGQRTALLQPTKGRAVAPGLAGDRARSIQTR